MGNSICTTECVRNIINDILSDGMPHSYQEIKRAIFQTNSELLVTNNTLSTVLSRMVKKDPTVFRPEKMVYQRLLFNNSKKEEMPASKDGLNVSAIQEGKMTMVYVRTLMDDMEKRFGEADCEISVEEFSERKKIYQLSKEIQALISKYLS